VQLPPSSNLFETGRYFGELNEYSVNNGVNITYKPNGKNKVGPTIKGGYYADYRAREFNSRYISYLYPGFFDSNIGQQLISLPLDQVFAPENIKTKDGFVIEEGTRPIDSYDASNLLGAAYANADIPLGKVNLNAGLRIEHNTQILNSRNDFEVITVDQPILSLLPFANAGYNLSDKSILRLGYGRTVNRPEFRELAPFLFYDYNLEAAKVGNPDLKNATIDNIDLRYEYYPRNGELISIAGFYKYFNDPIENKTLITTEQPQFTYINADFAQNYGVELELRKSLRGMTSSAFVDNFSLNLNGSLIFSNVDLGDIPLAQARSRALQGQSPYIVNAAVYYSGPKRTNVNLIYNVFGARIFSVGDVLFPTIYERPRNSLDINFSKTIKDKITYKLGVTDLLNARYRFYQDSDRNEKIDGNDDVIFSFQRGTLLTFNISYKL
jgi:TonB-dependent receptor